MRLPLHGLSSRQDLPLPFEFVLLGAALAIVLSFAVLAFAWRRPRYTQPRGYALPRLTRVVDSRACRLILRLFLLGLYGWMALALWFASNNGGLPGSARPVDLLASDPQAVVETAQRDAQGSAA